jgi:hypothetical protein
MDHDIGAWLDGLLWMALITIGRSSFIHLHVITALLLTLLLLVWLALALLFQIDLFAAGLWSRVLLSGRSSGVFGASHIGILALSRSSTLSFDFDFLLFLFLKPVLVAVRSKVGFGLVRGKLRWSRLLRIPVER